MRKLLTLAIAAILFVGCDDFGSTNVNPNEPSNPRTDLLMTEAQRGIGENVGAVTGTLYAQYFSETYYTDASTYSSTRADWSFWYSEPLQDLQTIIDLNSNEETRGETYVQAGGNSANQIAVARILKAYLMHMMTDRWGSLPYSEALNGSENFTPAYESADEIYPQLLTELKEATDQINTGAGAPTGDFFLGDMEQWVRFANTLRARIALRMADVEPGTAESEFMAAYNAGLIEENIMYPYLNNQNNDNPWQDRFETRTDYAISQPMVNRMKPLDDMRLLAYASPAPNYEDQSGLGKIQGMPYGLSQAAAGAISNAEVSFPGSAVGYENSTAPLPVITMAEVHFMVAEAAARGWGVTETAANAYNAGIEASWEQWGFDTSSSEFSNYMAQSDVQYDANNWKESIGVQKWIALFPQGYEAWSEWRRLDYPQLSPGPGANYSFIPVRQGPPSTEAELNSETYEENYGSFAPADFIGTKLWWDVN